MSTYRTANGKMVDMAALAAQNELTRAVGNANMNARGDKIDSAGNIIERANTRISNANKATISNNPAPADPVTHQSQSNQPAAPIVQAKPNFAELTADEIAMEEDDTPIIKDIPKKKTK